MLIINGLKLIFVDFPALSKNVMCCISFFNVSKPQRQRVVFTITTRCLCSFNVLFPIEHPEDFYFVKILFCMVVKRQQNVYTL